MKSKFIKYILISILTIFFTSLCSRVNAENKYKCQYYNKDGIVATGADVTHTFVIEIDKDKKTMRSYWVDSADTQDHDWELGEVNFIFDQHFNSSHNAEYFIKKFEGYGEDACQETVSICKVGGAWEGVFFGILFDTSLSSEIKAGDSISFINSSLMYSKLVNNDAWFVVGDYDFLYNNCLKNNSEQRCKTSIGKKKFGECKPFKFDENYEENGNSQNINYGCKRYSNNKKKGLYDKLKKYFNDYKKCNAKRKKREKTTCNLSEIAKNYNTTYNTLKEYCTSVIKTQYSSQPCMEKCLAMSKDMEEYRIDDTELEGYKCYLSEGIIAFVYNILKWAKYIVPALVIILSILDFIKAIVASSEDDMKKAQSKFIKRLIVAAILFLLPLIVNFMLKTFGLYNSKCDIGALFS